MNIAQKDIAALIGSRICHDLISPLGAIGNGVELLGMAGTVEGPEMALISESVMNANARIKYFRIAFGGAKAGQMIGREEVQSVLTDIGTNSRVKVDWSSDEKIQREHVKLAFLLIQCIESALPFGGLIEVNQGVDGWRLHCTAERVKIDPSIWEYLITSNIDNDISPNQVHFALVPDATKSAGLQLRTELQDHMITLTF